MKAIMRIFTTDLRNILTNWVALVIILTLIMLPSLYAWFNIKATWDPYGNTKKLAVAVTNQDRGTNLHGKYINVGNEIIHSLKDNRNLGWTFVDERHALNGVKHGQYYASIIIPDDFSKKITSILNTNPKKPIILFSVNEKVNAIAPKLTYAGATGVVQEISRNFVKTVSESIFSTFNKLGLQIERDLPTIEKLKELIFRIENDIPEINRFVNVAWEDILKAQSTAANVQENIPKAQKIAKSGMELSGNLSTFLNSSEEALLKLEPVIKENLVTLSELANSSQNVSAVLQNQNPDINKTKADISHAISNLNAGTNISDSINKTLNRLSDIASAQEMNPLTDKLNEVKTNNQQEANLLMQEIKNLENGNQTSEDTIQKVNNVSNRTTKILNYLLSNYDNQIVPTIKESITHAKKNISDATDILQQAEKDLPTIQKLLNDTSKGIGIGKTKISTIKNELPAIEGNIKEMANRIRDFESKENIYEIVNLLKNDVKKESDFLKEPVLLKKNKLYHIPNYGSAMSPFFTTLSLWVGAMLLISILSVDVKDDLNPKSVQVFFGRLLTFILIALLQSLIVTIGDIYLLRAYVVEKQWFILFGLLNSAIFMIMVYTLVSVFGNVGKCLGIIFLVLQISGSGGTFPIQVTPTFFQKINPFLPFTYSISLMRESVGGILWDVIQKDIMILTIYPLLSLLIGVLLKKRLNALSTGLVERAKNSKLLQ